MSLLLSPSLQGLPNYLQQYEWLKGEGVWLIERRVGGFPFFFVVAAASFLCSFLIRS